ncbi:MAG: replication-associated recombination protein A [Candidatus Margulisbacteria bacterium]|jgi:putative ATPase|nr:replication-associated recombination protein A [Candidatus Margulisiibacteriota bacterium]
MDLFKSDFGLPLAKRMAPQDFAEFVGQEHIIGEGRLLRRAIEADRLNSLIFSGPPGTGKTALANLIARKTQADFIQLNAVNSKVSELREVIAKAKETLAYQQRRTILFLDEIHRFNKAQQDALLPDVESGAIILIGATTENPYFGVNPALISRSQIFEFKALNEKESLQIIANCLAKNPQVSMAADAQKHLAVMAGGDARKILNAIDLAMLTTPPVAPASPGPAQDEPPGGHSSRQIHLTLGIIEESIQKKQLVYDESAHYDIISAFIKSMRGSDPDATVYWLAKMIYAGEDPRFIARRIVICASEDVGNADPLALLVANACLTTVSEIGYPEARLTLAQAALYVATAPKSNASYLAINKALDDLKSGLDIPVPKYLLNAVYAQEKKQGKGSGYQYAHDFPKGFARDLDFLPGGRQYYQPTGRGYEKKIQDWLKWLKE